MLAPPPRAILADLFHVALAAADPMRIVPRWLPDPPKGRTVVIGAGKASARMALAFEQAWPGPLSGVVVTRYGHAEPCTRIRVMEAAHPVPDAAGLAASQALLAAVQGLGPDDLVVALMSGGGSALLPAPPAGLTLADEQSLNRTLLQSGLAIGEMNLIRQHVSQIKGGRLAEQVGPARLVTLVLSDVPGDDPAQVASGPTVPSAGTRAQALAVIARSGLQLPSRVMAHLRAPEADAPKPSERWSRQVHVIGSAALSLEAAAMHARTHFGIEAQVLSDAIEGEASLIGLDHAELARRVQKEDKGATVLLSGGETSVRGAASQSRGGRNTEYALAFALGVQGCAGIHALAADTDGLDGNSEAAGAFVDGGTIGRLRARGCNPERALRVHDTASALGSIGDLLITGPTRTNVNDFRAILIDDDSATGS
jgi:hydroxypyruvate reductase